MELSNLVWEDHPFNPLIEPKTPSWLIADPTFLPSGKTPDGDWHLFANSLMAIYHFVSKDGIHWDRVGKIKGVNFRPFLFKDEGVFYLYYEKFTRPPSRSVMHLRTGKSLYDWSKPTTILKPIPLVEGEPFGTIGNPCMVKLDDRYRLYYSTGLVHLDDLGFSEPTYISFAESASPTGPFEHYNQPILGPDPNDPYRNLGAGAIKVLFDKSTGQYYGFNNGIYTEPSDPTVSRSAILLIGSGDGIQWRDVHREPILSPSDKEDWKKALVYQLDIRKVSDEYWLYYNARDGWKHAKERIGLAIGSMKTGIRSRG